MSGIITHNVSLGSLGQAVTELNIHVEEDAAVNKDKPLGDLDTAKDTMPTLYALEESILDPTTTVTKELLWTCGDEILDKWLRSVSQADDVLSTAHKLLDLTLPFDPDMLDRQYRRETLRVLALYYRYCVSGLLDIHATRSPTTQRFVRVMDVIGSMAEMVRMYYRTKYIADPLQETCDGDQSALVQKFRFSFCDRSQTSPYQETLLHLLKAAYQKGYRKQGTKLFKQIYTKALTESDVSFRTHAWTEAMDIETFIYESVRKEENFSAWLNFTSTKDCAKAVVGYLTNCVDFELPKLVPDRRKFSFANGLYDAQSNVFYDYGDAGGIPPQTVSAKYFDTHFDVDAYSQHEDWRDVPTPLFDKILIDQKFDKEVRDWVYVFLGRNIYWLGEYDQWQCIPFFHGRAGTGKSTALKLAANYYNPLDVGVLSNNLEKKFGVSAMLDKFIFLCYEVKGDFSLDQGEFQCMVSGEQMSIPVKNKTATCKTWNIHGMLAGNEVADWVDNSGSISRRVIMWDFTEPIRDGNPKLLGDIFEKEMAAIVYKSNNAYRSMADKYGNKDIWKALPKYFETTRMRMRGSTHMLAAFITSGDGIKLGPQYFMPLAEFKTMIQLFGMKNGYPKVKFAKDFFNMLDDFGLRIETVSSRMYKGKPLNLEWIVGVSPKDEDASGNAV